MSDDKSQTTGRPRLIMRHPEGCTMHHDGGMLAWFRDWRWWVWGLRNRYRFGIER